MEIEQRFETVAEYGQEIQKVYLQIGNTEDPVEISRLLDEICNLQEEQMQLMERISPESSALSLQDVDHALQKIDQLLYTDYDLEIYLSDCTEPLREEEGDLDLPVPRM